MESRQERTVTLTRGLKEAIVATLYDEKSKLSNTVLNASPPGLADRCSKRLIDSSETGTLLALKGGKVAS